MADTAVLVRRLGGPWGRRAGVLSNTWAYAAAILSWLIAMVRQVPCVNGTLDQHGWMCYSDITALYTTEGQVFGNVPYATITWEYPVLTGYFVTIANWIADLFGADLSPGIVGDQITTNTHIYFAINAVGLFLCLLWLISSMLKLTPGSPLLAMLVAISPAVWTTGLINWDLLAVALTAAGLAAWKEEKPVWAGLWWGLAVAAKFYPVVILGALLVLGLRRGFSRQGPNLKSWLSMLGVAALTWGLVNLPVMVTHLTGWAYFYQVQAENRSPSLGSLWYALSLAGINLGNPALWSRVLMIAGYIGLAVLIYLTPRAPSVAQIAYLAVAIMLVTSLVYSPQYVLWILPLIVLARPKILDLVIFTLAELNYYVFIWWFLRGDNLTLGLSGAPWMYIIAIVVRIGATCYVMTRVVQDMMNPTPDAPKSATIPDREPASPQKFSLFSAQRAPHLALQGWLASRLVLLVTLVVLVGAHGWTLTEALVRWDVQRFMSVAEYGYDELIQTAFFPGLPLVMTGFSLIGIPPLVTGVLFSLAGSAMAALALYKLAGDPIPGAVAVLIWSFAPMAVFTVVPYSEAGFAAFAFWAFLYAKRDRWAIAACLAGAACLFRVSGLFLIGALGLLALLGSAPTLKRRVVRLAWLGIPTAVLAAYVIYLRVRFGSWTVWFSAQGQGWGRHFDWPWNAFIETLHVAGIVGTGYSTYMMFRWEVVAFLIGLAVSVWCLVKKKIPEGGYVLVQVVALSCQVWLISIARAMLLWFPMFTLIGSIGDGVHSHTQNTVRRVGLVGLLFVECVAMVWWAARFFSGEWAG